MPGKPRRQHIAASPQLGRFVARQRELLGLSQTDLATELDMSSRTLSSLENGRRPIYDVQEAEAFADALKIRTADLEKTVEGYYEEMPMALQDDLRKVLSGERPLRLADREQFAALEKLSPSVAAVTRLAIAFQDATIDAFLNDDPLPVVPLEHLEALADEVLAHPPPAERPSTTSPTEEGEADPDPEEATRQAASLGERVADRKGRRSDRGPKSASG